MFGQNALLKPIRDLTESDGRYWVQEVFRTLQGEGPNTGLPAIFVRMAGCNLRCHFCDTDFESSTWRPTPRELYERIEEVRAGQPISLVVITGGEPLRQPLGDLVDLLFGRGNDPEIQIETAGTIWDNTLTDHVYQGGIDIVCSPKTASVHKMVAENCRDWKYIVHADDCDPEDGLPMYSTQDPGRPSRLFRPPDYHRGGLSTIWVQPMDVSHPQQRAPSGSTRDNIEHAIQLCYRHGYRLSLQTHKLLGLP